MTGKPDGLARGRNEAVLDAGEPAEARASGVELAYCPLQQGWVALTDETDDDILPPLSGMSA
jgi:hypothetical protein